MEALLARVDFLTIMELSVKVISLWLFGMGLEAPSYLHRHSNVNLVPLRLPSYHEVSYPEGSQMVRVSGWQRIPDGLVLDQTMAQFDTQSTINIRSRRLSTRDCSLMYNLSCSLPKVVLESKELNSSRSGLVPLKDLVSGFRGKPQGIVEPFTLVTISCPSHVS